MKKIISSLLLVMSLMFVTACNDKSPDTLALELVKNLSDGDDEAAYSLLYISTLDQNNLGVAFIKGLLKATAENAKKKGGFKKYEVSEISDYSSDKKDMKDFKNLKKVTVLIEYQEGKSVKSNIIVGELDGKNYVVDIFDAKD